MRLAELLEQWRNDDLKEYVLLLGGRSTITRKAERIEFIAQTMLDKASLRAIWQGLDGISRRAISVAFHNEGEFGQAAFVAQYGTLPPRPKKRDGRTSYYYKVPILFDLFVIGDHIPDDIMPLMADLVLPPERFQLEGAADAPSQLELGGRVEDVTAVETELIGRTDLLTYLRFMEQDQLRFGPQNQRLTAASLRKVLANLMAGDFREPTEKVTARTTIRPTGLDVFTQESGLATRTGKLTKAGRTYLSTQDPAIMLEAFEKWATGGKFEELHRIAQLGGLNARGTQLTEPAYRRDKVIEALSWCPAGQWIAIGDFYRAILIWNFDFEVEQSRFSNLYVGSRYYGELTGAGDSWRITHGLYINVILWEYLGTIGAVDVAFLQDDFESALDTDYLPIEGPISLYDGLTHFRINPWGAYLLGQAAEYVPSQPRRKTLFTIDNDRRVHLSAPLAPNERLHLEIMADPIDESTYQLDQMKLLGAVEGGQDLDNLIEFLRSSHDGELPPVLFDWLFQLRRNLGALTQTDTAVLIQLNQPGLMEMVQRDDVLAKICQPLSASTILVRSSNVARLSRHLKTLGYVLG